MRGRNREEEMERKILGRGQRQKKGEKGESMGGGGE